MNDANTQPGELISALLDGEIQANELHLAVDAATGSGDGLAAWRSYRLVGEALRGQLRVPAAEDPAFLTRLRARLADEAPDRAQPQPVAVVPVAAGRHPDSANDALVRWKLLAGAASLAAVAVIGWHVASVQAPASALAGAQPPATASGAGAPALAVAQGAGGGAASPSAPPVMLRDERLDALMAAHKQFGGTSALQMPAGFLRNATFEGSER